MLLVGCSKEKDNENLSMGIFKKDVECKCGLIYNVTYNRILSMSFIGEVPDYQTYTSSPNSSMWEIKLDNVEIYPFTTYHQGGVDGSCTWECSCGNKLTVFDKNFQ